MLLCTQHPTYLFKYVNIIQYIYKINRHFIWYYFKYHTIVFFIINTIIDDLYIIYLHAL